MANNNNVNHTELISSGKFAEAVKLPAKLYAICSKPFRSINNVLLNYNLSINYLHFDSVLLKFIKKVRSEHDLGLTTLEAIQLYQCAESALKIKGDYAEVGVYRGGSSMIICKAKDNRPIHLFDTFAGLPKPKKIDKDFSGFCLTSGEFDVSLDEVKQKLTKYKQVYFYPGLFPNTAIPVRDKRFAFVHLDVDLYQSTKDALEFFYPRLNKGGIILTHDFIFEGVKKAFYDFFDQKPESIIRLSTTQALVIKIR